MPRDIANSFNKYFTEIEPNQAQRIGRTNTNFNEYLHQPSNKSIYFKPTNILEILNIVQSLKSTHSSVHDEVSTRLLKQIIRSVLTPLVHIFSLLLITGIFPSPLKIANVIPIRKKDDPACVSNYTPIYLVSPKYLDTLFIIRRMISLLPMLCFILTNMVSENFRKFLSTDLALAQFYDRVSSALASREHVFCVFMDLTAVSHCDV